MVDSSSHAVNRCVASRATIEAVGHSEAERQLKFAIAHALRQLQRERGISFSEVGRQVGRSRHTVSNWARARTLAPLPVCEQLAERWPQYFDGPSLRELYYRTLSDSGSIDIGAVGVQELASTAEVFAAAADVIDEEPEDPRDRVIRFAAFHRDQRGVDPATDDPHIDDDSRRAIERFRSSMSERATQGWLVQMVVSTGNPVRLRSVCNVVEQLDGPQVEIVAYPHRLPLSISPLVIANRTVMFGRDHRRFERPGSALLIRSRPIAGWATQFIADLIADAEFKLRTPAGLDRRELDRYCQHVIGHAEPSRAEQAATTGGRRAQRRASAAHSD